MSITDVLWTIAYLVIGLAAVWQLGLLNRRLLGNIFLKFADDNHVTDDTFNDNVDWYLDKTDWIPAIPVIWGFNKPTVLAVAGALLWPASYLVCVTYCMVIYSRTCKMYS